MFGSAQSESVKCKLGNSAAWRHGLSLFCHQTTQLRLVVLNPLHRSSGSQVITRQPWHHGSENMIADTRSFKITDDVAVIHRGYSQSRGRRIREINQIIARLLLLYPGGTCPEQPVVTRSNLRIAHEHHRNKVCFLPQSAQPSHSPQPWIAAVIGAVAWWPSPFGQGSSTG